MPAREAIATLAYHFQCRFISRHSVFWRHLSYAAKLTLTSTLSKGTDLNVSADLTFSLFCSSDTSLVLLDCLFLANKFFSALENRQLVVIKTEREAKEENRVTEMSGKKKIAGIS